MVATSSCRSGFSSIRRVLLVHEALIYEALVQLLVKLLLVGVAKWLLAGRMLCMRP